MSSCQRANKGSIQYPTQKYKNQWHKNTKYKDTQIQSTMTNKCKIQWHTNKKYNDTHIQNAMKWHWIQVQWNANLKRLICWFSISQTDTILRYLYQRKHQLSLIQIYILPDNPQTTAHALIGEKDNEISLQISFLCHLYVCSQISSILTEFKAKQAFSNECF